MTQMQRYYRPASIAAALTLRREVGEDCRFIAGGTDVVPNMFHENDTARIIIDLSAIEELRGIRTTTTTLSIGALHTLEDVCESEELAAEFPAVIDAARLVGSPAIRKTASIGGNLLCENRCRFYNQSSWWRDAVGLCLKCEGDICIATGGKKKCFSKFSSDIAPVLMSMNAHVEVISLEGSRVMALELLYSGDGIKPRLMRSDEIIRRVMLDRGQIRACVVKKLRPRSSVDFSSLTSSVCLYHDRQLKIVLGSVDPAPVSIKARIDDDVESIIHTALKKSRIIDNDMYSRSYRRHMLQEYLRSSIEQLRAML